MKSGAQLEIVGWGIVSAMVSLIVGWLLLTAAHFPRLDLTYVLALCGAVPGCLTHGLAPRNRWASWTLVVGLLLIGCSILPGLLSLGGGGPIWVIPIVVAASGVFFNVMLRLIPLKWAGVLVAVVLVGGSFLAEAQLERQVQRKQAAELALATKKLPETFERRVLAKFVENSDVKWSQPEPIANGVKLFGVINKRGRVLLEVSYHRVKYSITLRTSEDYVRNAKETAVERQTRALAWLEAQNVRTAGSVAGVNLQIHPGFSGNSE